MMWGPQPVGTCACHACTCPGCRVCDPPEQDPEVAEYLDRLAESEPPTDPWGNA